MNLQRYFIGLSYNGTRFHGWQRQPNAHTIQQYLEEALSMMLRSPVSLTGAGRTDTGVHASEYFAHFDHAGIFNVSDCEKLVFRLNAFLNQDISIHSIFPVESRTHARFSAIARTYQYRIARNKNPFTTEFTWFVYGKINVELMNTGASLLMNYSDFTSFSKVDTDTMTNICRITYAHWDETNDELVFTITADRFLRNMVRAVTGTLLELGHGRISLEKFREIIESKNRSNAGESVPARGLTLTRIEYP